MAIRTVQLGSPRLQIEGVRIGAVRYLPRGVRKDEYAKLNYFDVWLPVLAPSKGLLSRKKSTNMSFDSFARSYRSEMKHRDALQAIQLLAAMAEQTELSVGCFCPNENQCHRSLLIELIQGAADKPIVAKPTYSPYCVYTIAHPDELREAFEQFDSYTLPESKPWVVARGLLTEAQLSGQLMPVLFGDATDCSRLLYWGLLSNIEIDGDGTRFTFHSMANFSRLHAPQELRLKSTGKYIADNFIRPYAICHTPGFL